MLEEEKAETEEKVNQEEIENIVLQVIHTPNLSPLKVKSKTVNMKNLKSLIGLTASARIVSKSLTP